MDGEWLGFWSKTFLEIAIYKTLFNWGSLLIISGIAFVYLLWVTFRKEIPDPKNQENRRSIFRALFKFRRRDLLFYTSITCGILLLTATLGISVTLHAAAFDRAMQTGCLAVEESADTGKFIFTLKSECAAESGGGDLLWTRVELEQEAGKAAATFLKNKSSE